MLWLIFSTSNDLIGKKCATLLLATGQTVNHQVLQQRASPQIINNLIQQEKADRILVTVNSTHGSLLHQSIDDQILLPLLVCQATLQSLSRTSILIVDSSTNDFNQEILQDAVEQLIHIHPNVINVKLINPIDDEDINLDYFRTIWRENCEERHRLTVLSDILPILLALIHDGRASGHLNVSNKGTVSLQSIENLKNQAIREKSVQSTTDDFTDEFEAWSQHKIQPETRQLYQIPFDIPHLSKSIREIIEKRSMQNDPNAPKIILVTGGCGFIGSTFINFWLKTHPNDKIINIDRLDLVANTKNIDNPDSPNYSLVVADINNKDIVLHLMNQYNVTHIVHFAVQAHVDNSFGNSITFTESNVYGTHSVLEALRIYGKIEKFIHISTDEVYGETPSGSQQEIFLLNPSNPYAATIAAAEFLVKSYGESFKLPYSIVRLCNVYGPRQHIEKVIPKFIQQLSNGKNIVIEGDGKQIRHYLYVDDVVRAIELIFIKGKTKFIYNVSTGNAVSVRDIAHLLQQKLRPDAKLEDLIEYGKSRSFKENRYHGGTMSSSVKTLGWKEEVHFNEGLDRTIQWLKSHPNYWNKSN